ncbi:MAG: TetR/AcrR family transcriptional regulator [Halieaceae bacterium]|jgi:AcrR family transcriptional regulator|nr:TetR/AcrR family transcriptional regulator [Halieaceae bacterium]
MGNRQRIIDAAVELMNINGSAVGTTQLVQHLSISPGNLYYHFRNREEILLEILSRLQRDLDEVLELQSREALDAQRLARCFVGGAHVLWQYRFFFSSTLELVMKDAHLSQQYRDFSIRGTHQVEKILQRAFKAAAGPIKLTAPQRRQLAENMWVLWTSWPRYIEILKGKEIGKAEITRSYKQLTFLLQPYLSGVFFTEVEECAKSLAVIP